MKGKRARARMIRAEALALSAMMASMNVMPALADSVTPEIGIEASKEDESGEKNLASSSNATPVEEDNTNKEIETEEDEEDTEEDFEFEEELENDLESSESSENEEDTESSESSESLKDTENSENETKEDMSETEDIESELETEVDLDQIQVATPSDLEKPEMEPMSMSYDFTINYHMNDGTDTIFHSDSVEYETMAPEFTEIPEREGFVFKGWYTEADCINEFDTESILYDNTDVYAKWGKEIVYREWNDSEDSNWQFFPSEDGTCSIKPLSDIVKKGAVVIPEEVDGFTVTSIGASAFESNGNITSVVIPDSVKEIKEKAFRGTKITKFEANGVKTIGASAFYGCQSLVTFTTPNVVELGNSVFNRCSRLKTVNISVSVIPYETFAHCKALTNYDFTGVESIGERAFGWCEGLTTTLELANVKSIGEGAFISCSFTSVNLTGVETIGNSAFGSNRYLKTVKLTDVKSIGNFAFKQNKGITTLELTGIENMGREAFAYCEGLTTLKLTGAKSIDNQAFGWCKGLTTLELTDIESIGKDAFVNCNGLKSVTLNNIGTIGDNTFQSCEGITDLNISNIGTIGAKAFLLCNSLIAVNLNNVETIGVGAFQNLPSITSVTLDNVGTVGNSAFRKCTGLTELNIGSVGTIEGSSFAECTNLKTVDIDEVSGTVKEYAFNNSGVETINIGSINNAEYNSLVATEKITIDYAENLGGAKAKIIEITSGNNVMCGNYWPANYAGGSNNICETITIGDVRGTVKAFAFNSVTIDSAENVIADADVVNIKLADNILKVGGREVNITEASYLKNIVDNDYENSWRINGLHEIERLNIKNVGTIDNDCFKDRENLNTVIIESAGTIGDEAFRNCQVLSDLQISTVNKIGRSAFSCCRSLEKLETQDLGEIGDNAFDSCTSLKLINLGNVNKIGNRVFNNLNLETVNMGNVGEIGEAAFAENEKLITVTMGEIHKMGVRTFERCTELETVNWTCKLETLPERAFYYDGKLKSIDLGSDLRTIGHKALFKCNSIKELTIPAGVDTVNVVDLCGEYDYSGEADFDNRGYTLIFLGDNTDFEIRYGEESILGDNDDSIIINELVLPSKDSKAYQRMTSLDNTDIVKKVGGGSKNVLYHAVVGYTKATYKDGVVNGSSMLTPPSDGNMGKEVDWSWWSVYKDIGNEVGDSSNVGGQGTGRVIQHTIINAARIDDVLIDGDTEDNKEKLTITYHTNDDTENDIFHVDNGVQGEKAPDFTDIPTRENHEFKGWYMEPECVNEFDKETVLEGSIDLYAKWEENTEDDNKEKITITFWINDGTEDIWRRLEDVEKGSMLQVNHSELGKEKYEFTGWYMEPECENKAENRILVEKDLDLYAGWKLKDTEDDNKEKVTVTFYRNDGTEDIHKREEIEKNTTPDFADIPTRENYEFKGWYKDPEGTQSVDENTPVEEDTNYYAKWESTENDDNKEKIKLIYWLNDGTDGAWMIMLDLDKGTPLNLKIVPPNRDGYEFKGWYMEPECENRAKHYRPLENDTNVYAKWERKDTGSGSGGGGTTDVKEKVTITYYLNDGTEDIFKRDQIEKGDSPDMSVEPSRKGYEFKGWYYEAECENKVPDDITVEEDTDFYASWKKIDSGSSGGGSGETPDKPDDKEEPIKVTYYENDGTPDIYKTEKIEKGDTPDTSGEPKRDGYEFKGWYEEPECETPVDPSKPLEEDTNFYAKWEKKDTDPSGNDKPDDKNEDNKKPEDKPDNKPEDKVEKVKVTYHNNDDTDKIYKTEEIEKGGTPDTKGNPDRDKYEFTGWYLDPECKVPVDPSKPLEEDTDLYAGWKKKDTIPTGNGSHGGGGSHGGSTVRVVNVHEDKPEPEKTTIGENGVPQGDTDKEEVNTSTLNENGVPKDRAEEKDSLPKTGDKRNILVYWITFISSLSSMAVIGLKDRLKRVSRQRKN